MWFIIVKGCRVILESGDFLALDLGGTNFRVLKVSITRDPDPKIEMDNQVYSVSDELMTGTGTAVSRFCTAAIFCVYLLAI